MMHYLECIAMLEYLLKKLYSGQRQQVSASIVTTEVQPSIIQIQKRLENEDDLELSTVLRDTLESTLVISSTAGLQYLSDTMKGTLSEGLNTLKANICMKAFEYFKLHDFEPTADIVPIMRAVVQVALEKGAL